MSLHRLHLAAALAATLSVLLTGCNSLQTGTAAPTTEPGAQIRGRVHGGLQIITGAHIYLFATGSGGYGAPSTSLLNPAIPGVYVDSRGAFVPTGSDGGFSLGGAYTCTSGQIVYLLALGGNPGLGGNANNPALALMSVLGTCPATGNFAAAVPFLNVNEVSTVAAVYALSGFMSSATAVSSASTPASLRGLQNAFAAVPGLVDIGTGAALAQTDSGGIAPQAELNALANVLVPCINSTGTGCLFL